MFLLNSFVKLLLRPIAKVADPNIANKKANVLDIFRRKAAFFRLWADLLPLQGLIC
jgi:hypothetical protein